MYNLVMYDLQALRNLVKRSSQRVMEIFNELDRRLKSVEDKKRSEVIGEEGGVEKQQRQKQQRQKQQRQKQQRQKTRGLRPPDMSSPTTTK